MAENKRDLVLTNTGDPGKRVIRQTPWYRERARTKCIRALSASDRSRNLIGRKWTFLKDGLDDFRDGIPPLTNGKFLVEGSKDLGPNIIGRKQKLWHVKEDASMNRFTKEQICFSRTLPLQQQHWDHINEIERVLSEHPLALYPHLQASISPQIFEAVVEILDPEMNVPLETEETLDQEQIDEKQPEEEFSDEERTPLELQPNYNQEFSSELETKTVRNPYRWLPRKEDKEIEQYSSSFLQELHVKKVTKEFCNWVASLGGDKNNIEESTITSLFASGYETKPALSVPIHVVDITSIPLELRLSSSIRQSTATSSDFPKTLNKKCLSRTCRVSDGTRQKFHYGAWYLSPKTWKKRNWNEPLRNPEELKKEAASAAKKESQELNRELSTIHGTNVFMEYMDKRGTRKPEFLNEIDVIQKQAAIEAAEAASLEKANKAKQNVKKPFP